ncbi:MAG TPA: DHH family phosphoesterase [Candidatus Bilamarchaeum sp.]|nr:DHH family phosphoesterase [Candidatus Bilamarchaeum sp.]
MRDEEGFFERCQEIRRLALSFADPLIVHHYDADGLSSGALVCSAFIDEGKKFRRECIKKLDDAAIERYLASGEKEIIFVDLGGGNRRVNELKDAVIIDHHQTDSIEKPQANPLLFGIDGGDELSAAGTAFCVFRKRADLAIVGAVGDMQHPLKGMNRWVLAQGLESGEAAVEEDLKMYGRYSRPLVQFLAYCDEPVLPGITYREDRAAEFLNEAGIRFEGRKYMDLDVEEKRSLVSAIARLLISSGRLEGAESLMGESYVFPKRPKDETYEASEFSTLLNACGRHSRPEVGLKVCLGDAEALSEARALLALHRKMLREGIEFAQGGVQDFGAFKFLDGRGKIDEGIVGIVCGMVMRQGWAEPIIGIAEGEGGTIKVSGRASRAQVAAGMNLGELMKAGCQRAGGAGGGHKIAAGASIPEEKLNEFLLAAGEYLKGFYAEKRSGNEKV